MKNVIDPCFHQRFEARAEKESAAGIVKVPKGIKQVPDIRCVLKGT